MVKNENLKTIPLSEIHNLKVHGRTTSNRMPLTLFWTGSGIELNVKASELWIEVESDYSAYEPWISILINDEQVSRMMVVAGKYPICIFRGMNENTVKNVKVIREVQAMSGDEDCCLQIHSLSCDGEYLEVADKPYKIEFIGDSITSGEGIVGSKEEDDWISMWFGVKDNYATLTAKALNADYRILSQSGWGVYTSWDNNPNCALPLYYPMVCGLLQGDKNLALGAHEQNDFTIWQPDVIVVSLGTNDCGAFYNPEWKDPKTGKTYKQRLNTDGTFHKEDLKNFENAVTEFLHQLRKYNPNAHIVWAYGILGAQLMPAIYRGVEVYKQETQDEKVIVTQLINTTEETMGARSHPGALSHQLSAKVLAHVIGELLG